MTPRYIALAPLLAAAGLAACQTTPAADSGYLAHYDDMKTGGRNPGVAVRQRRDDAASDAVRNVFIEPAVIAQGIGEELTPTERAMVLREVDRQICYEVSERFTIVSAPAPESATIRTAVVRLQPTGRAGSAASAAVGYFVPVVKLRAPTTTGGIAVESEMLEAGSRRQIAALAWARNAQWIGRDTPSLSRVGDALQMAEPLGDAVGDAFASEARVVNAIPDPDPCAAFGPRREIARGVAGAAVGFATGLYSPEVSGTGAATPASPN